MVIEPPCRTVLDFTAYFFVITLETAAHSVNGGIFNRIKRIEYHFGEISRGFKAVKQSQRISYAVITGNCVKSGVRAEKCKVL